MGKTVYLGMLLDLLSRGAGGLQGLSRSPFSLTLHRNLILALERQRFPEKTPVETDRWHWLHCEVLAPRSKGTVDIVTPDVAGEAVMAEMENPGTNKTIRALISRCAGMVVLVDLVQVVADGQSSGALRDAAHQLSRRPAARQEEVRKVDVPVAVVFTKADLFEEWIGDPEAFARGNVAGLTRSASRGWSTVPFFCSGVAGSTAKLVDQSGQESLVPLRIEPHGVIEPFAWMVSQLAEICSFLLKEPVAILPSPPGRRCRVAADEGRGRLFLPSERPHPAYCPDLASGAPSAPGRRIGVGMALSAAQL